MHGRRRCSRKNDSSCRFAAPPSQEIGVLSGRQEIVSSPEQGVRRARAALPDGWHAAPPGNFLAPSLAMAWLGRSDRPQQEYSIIRRARQRRLGYSQVTTSRWQLFCDGLQRACKKMHRRSAMSCGIFSTARSGRLFAKHARSASGILKTRSRPGNYSATGCSVAELL